MKELLKNKKLILIILSLILLLILYSNYIKTREIELGILAEETFQQESPTKKKEILKTKKEAENKIESIALIKEIKDPFQKDAPKNENETASAEKTAKTKQLKINKKDELIYLEKNIIAEEIIDKREKSPGSNKAQPELSKESAALVNKERTFNSKEAALNQKLKNIRLPFKLLGIIKNKSNSSALFLYQGQHILKEEKERIDIFKIEEINNKNIILSYQNQKKSLHLWEGEINENKN
jgi:hypothetical protein